MHVHRTRVPHAPSVSVRRLAIPVVAALLLILASVVPALANGGGGSYGPSYKAIASTPTAAAGTQASTTITLTQLVNDDYWGSKSLGSVKVTPPSGFTIVSASAARGSTSLTAVVASGTVTVDNVDLKYAGKTATVTVVTAIACGVTGASTWGLSAHQTSSYSSYKAKELVRDPSSQLTTTVSPCSLAFARQPARAGVGAAITSVAGNPSGASVAVQLRNGAGNPAAIAGVGISLAIEPGTGTVGATLGGTTSGATDGTGLATFAPTISLSGLNYALRATAGTGMTSALSGAFDIADVAVACSGACSATASNSGTTATVSGSSNGGSLAVSLGLENVDCNNAANHFYTTTSQIVSFDITPATGRTLVTIKLAKAQVTKSFLAYEVCFSSPSSSFTNKYGVAIAAGQAGILPWCLDCLNPSGGPCVVLKWFDLQGNVYVKFSVPLGDPKGGI